MRRLLRSNTVLIISIGILLIFSLFAFIETTLFYEVIEQVSFWVRDIFGTFYLWLGLGCVLFLIILSLSPLGKIRLGSQDDSPEFSRWAWIAMLYSAGMGAGILLRAVQEPIYMYVHTPIATSSNKSTIALEYTFYQWGFTAWAFYGLFALIFGYYVFTKKRPLLVSTAVVNNVNSRKGIGIDILAVITTVFGLMGAIALGTVQISGGLTHVFTIDSSILTLLFLIILIALLSFVSVWSGMQKGIKIISTANILVTLIIFSFVILQSDILVIAQRFVESLYRYIIDFIPLSLAIGNYDPGKEFLTDWTYYYWAFWLAWAPFTGVFIARISKGRTIREMLLGVLIIPSLGTFLWFTVFGSSAFDMIDAATRYDGRFDNVFTSIFVFFENYPFASILNVITILLLISFLVTSVDSAVFVLSIFSDKGNPDPKKSHRLIWSICIAVFTIALVILSTVRDDVDVLVALQKLLIITSLPFAILSVLIAARFVLSLTKGVKQS